VELLVVFVPLSLNVDDSSLDESAGVSSGLDDGSEWSSLSGVGDTSNSDLVVASGVESLNGEGLLRRLYVNPDTSGVNLVRHLPALVTGIGPGNSDRVGGLLGGLESGRLAGWSFARGWGSLRGRSHWNTGRGVGDGQEGGSDNDVGVGLRSSNWNGHWGGVWWTH